MRHRFDDLRTDTKASIDHFSAERSGRFDQMGYRLDTIETRLRGFGTSAAELRGYVAGRSDLFPDIISAE